MEGRDVQALRQRKIKSSTGNQILYNYALFHGQCTVRMKTQQASNQTKHKQQPGTMKGKEIMFFHAHLRLNTLIHIYKSPLVIKKQFRPQSE